jgi:hypothetical protein
VQRIKIKEIYLFHKYSGMPSGISCVCVRLRFCGKKRPLVSICEPLFASRERANKINISRHRWLRGLHTKQARSLVSLWLLLLAARNNAIMSTIVTCLDSAKTGEKEKTPGPTCTQQRKYLYISLRRLSLYI